MALYAVIPPDDQMTKRILDDIHTTQEQLDRDVETLKEWLKLQPHLPQNVFGDTHIASFIIGCKNSLDKAKVKIDTYLTNRSKVPEIYGNRDFKSDEFLEDEAASQAITLPNLTPEGYSVGLARLVDPDSEAITFSNFLKRVLINIDVTLMTRYQGGFSAILDFNGFNMKLIAKISLPLVVKFLTCLQDGMPVRIKDIFLLNVPSLAQHIINVVKMMVNEKLRKKIHIYSGDHSDLYTYIPKEMLPNEYGGEAGTCEDMQRATNEFQEGFRDWFIADSKLTVDESKRPEKSAHNLRHYFDFIGSLKKSNID